MPREFVVKRAAAPGVEAEVLQSSRGGDGEPQPRTAAEEIPPEVPAVVEEWRDESDESIPPARQEPEEVEVDEGHAEEAYKEDSAPFGSVNVITPQLTSRDLDELSKSARLAKERQINRAVIAALEEAVETEVRYGDELDGAHNDTHFAGDELRRFQPRMNPFSQACEAAVAQEGRPLDAYEISIALEEIGMDHVSKGAGVQMMRQCALRMMRGDLGVRIDVWREAANRSREEAFSEANKIKSPLFNSVIADGWQKRLDDRKRWDRGSRGARSGGSFPFRREQDDEMDESPGSSMEADLFWASADNSDRDQRGGRSDEEEEEEHLGLPELMGLEEKMTASDHKVPVGRFHAIMGLREEVEAGKKAIDERRALIHQQASELMSHRFGGGMAMGLLVGCVIGAGLGAYGFFTFAET